MAYVTTRSLQLHASTAATPAAADNTNTIKSLVFGTVIHNQGYQSTIVRRNSLDPLGDRSVIPYIEQVSPVSFSFNCYADAEIGGVVLDTQRAFWVELFQPDNPWNWGPTHDTFIWNGQNNDSLIPLHLWFEYDNLVYLLADCAIETITVNLDVNGLTYYTVSGSALSITADAALPSTFYDMTVQRFGFKNKAAIVTLIRDGITYDVPLSGGSITYKGNTTFTTSSEISKISVPNGYYKGSKEIYGSLSFYVKTGTDQSNDLYKSLLSAAMSGDGSDLEALTTDLTINISTSAAPNSGTIRTQYKMYNCVLGLPQFIAGDALQLSVPFYAPIDSASNTRHVMTHIP